MTALQTVSTLTCPECGQQKTETMPSDSCLFYYGCEQCKILLRPKAGECCVSCSYGMALCPAIQRAH